MFQFGLWYCHLKIRNATNNKHFCINLHSNIYIFILYILHMIIKAIKSFWVISCVSMESSAVFQRPSIPPSLELMWWGTWLSIAFALMTGSQSSRSLCHLAKTFWVTSCHWSFHLLLHSCHSYKPWWWRQRVWNTGVELCTYMADHPRWHCIQLLWRLEILYGSPEIYGTL